MKKIVSILVCMLLITSGVFFVFKNLEVKADPPGDGGGEGELTNTLDFEYMWNVTTYLANIIHNETVYEPGEIKKGRYFGSDGDRHASKYLVGQFINKSGFSIGDVRRVQLKNIEGKEFEDTDYTELVEVMSYGLTINHPDFPFNKNLKQENFMSIAAVRAEGEFFNYTMNRSFTDIQVINEENFTIDFSLWETGIDEKNIPFNELNNCSIILGNITYVPSGENISEYQNYETIFLLDEVDGVENKIENATNASGIILIDDTSIGYEFENASEYNIPITNIDSDETNLTTIKQYLENGTRVVVDSTILEGNLTFIHNMTSPACWPDEQFVLVYNRTHEKFGNLNTAIFTHVNRVWLRNGFHLEGKRCRGIILYDDEFGDETENCHKMFVQNIFGIRMGKIYPIFALPGFSVKKQVGEFLWNLNDDEDNTISGHVYQIHREENASSPGVESYNVEADLSIDESPNDEVVVISSRFDAMWSECPGDSGAGNGIIMGIAEYMQRLNQSGIQPKYNITFLMTTNEENGMYGAQFFSDSHTNDNIKMWIGTDQLGFNNGSLHNVYKNQFHRNIGENISILYNYEDETEYGMFHNTTTEEGYCLQIHLFGAMGVGAEDVVFYERDNPNCDTILVHKSDFTYHHRRGLNFTDGDNLDNMDRKDVNMFYNLTWYIIKYFTYNPDCIFTNKISYSALDSPLDEDELNDSIKITFDINTVMLNDHIMVDATLFDPMTAENITNIVKNYTIDSNGINDSIIVSLPSYENQDQYVLKVKLYNSTGRINEFAEISGQNWDDETNSSMYYLYPLIPETYPSEITNVSDTPDTVGFGLNVTINADVYDNVSGVDEVNVSIGYPGPASKKGNFTMSHMDGDTYEYVFDNTWQVGQYNYTIWAVDNASNSNSSSGYSFNVSANATISICTMKNTYGTIEEYINITDPPPAGNEDGPYHYWNAPENSFGMQSMKTVNWSYFWNLFRQHSDWQLEAWHPVNEEWVDEWQGTNLNEWLDISKIRNDDNSSEKIILNVTNNHPTQALKFRFKFGIDLRVKEYVNRSGVYEYEFTYPANDAENYTVFFNWSDMIPLIQNDTVMVRHGIKEYQGNDIFWFMITANQTLGAGNSFEIDPIFGSTTGYSSSYEILAQWDVTKYENIYGIEGSPASSGTADCITAYLRAKTVSDDVTCALYYASNGTFLASTEEKTIATRGWTWYQFNFTDSVPLDSALNYYIVAYGDADDREPHRRTGYATIGKGGVGQIYYESAVNNYSTFSDPFAANIGSENTLSIYCSYNVGPVISNPYPSDGATNISISPTLNITVSDADSDTMDITWYSNSSDGSNWTAFGTNSSVSDGTYHQTMTNASVNGQWWYWNVSVDDGIQTVWSDVYKFYTGVQSKIVNTGSTNISGYLLIQVQYNDSGEWVVDNDTINETTPRTINAGDTLPLDLIFNGNVSTDDLTHGDGTYRVYAAFRDPDGDVLICDDATKLEAWWPFEVDTS